MQDYSWTDIRCPFEKRRDAACVFWDNVVYILGGSQLFPIKRMDCYNVVKDSWYSKLGPPTPRDSLAACAAEGKIYTSGGSEVGKTLKIFKPNPKKKKAQTKIPGDFSGFCMIMLERNCTLPC